jgi:hypothetical protein
MHKDKQAAAANSNGNRSSDGNALAESDSSSKANDNGNGGSSSSSGDDTCAERDSNSNASGKAEGNASGSISSGDDTCAERDSNSKADGNPGNGVVHSMGRYDPDSDKFVTGSSNGHEMTAEEQLAIKGPGSMTAKGAEWGLLQLDLSFAWQLQDKAVEDVHKMLEQAAAVANYAVACHG